MSKFKTLILASMLLAAPAIAQDAPPPLTASGKQQLEENMTKRRAVLTPLVEKRQALRKQYDALMTPAGYDEAKLTATMTEMRLVEGQIVETQQNAVLALLKSLSDDDRKAYLTAARAAAAPPARPKAAEGR